MAWPVYSERFLRVSTANTWVYYVVPAGHRAVVKSWDALNGTAAAASASGQVNGFSIFQRNFPAQIESYHQDAYIVVYGGQQIAGKTSATTVFMICSGWLFQDPTGATGPPGLVLGDDLPHVEQLPGDLTPDA